MKTVGKLLLLALLVGVGWWAWQGPLAPVTIFLTFPLDQQRAFETALLRYEQMVALPKSGDTTLSDHIPRHGKVLMLLTERDSAGHVHPQWFDLPRSLRATSPAEVETVVFINFVPQETLADQSGTGVSVHTQQSMYLLAFSWPSQAFLGRMQLKTWPSNYTRADVMKEYPNVADIVQKMPVQR